MFVWMNRVRQNSVGADDPVRPDDDCTVSDRADRVVGPYRCQSVVILLPPSQRGSRAG